MPEMLAELRQIARSLWCCDFGQASGNEAVWLVFSAPLHSLCGCVERSRNALSRRLIERTSPKAEAQRQLQVLHAPDYRGRHAVMTASTGWPDAGKQGIDSCAVGGQEGLALRRDTVALAACSFGFDHRIAHIFEPRECRIDDARTWAVAAAHAFLDGLHELIAVARLLRDHGEDKEPKLSIVEKPAAMAASMMPVTAAVAPMMEPSPILGLIERTVRTVSVSVFHEGDIGRDISHVKIYRDLYRRLA